MTSLPTTASSSALPRAGLPRALELVAIFLGLPLLVRWHVIAAPRLVVLAVVTAGAMAALWADPTFERSRLISLGNLRASLRGIAVRAVVGALVIFGLARALGPRAIPDAATGSSAWLLGLVLYPLISAWPQELVYRVFFFHRYGPLLGSRAAVVAANALAFGALHLIYASPVAPLLSVPAGALLASTYARSTTLAPVWLEHSLYGLAVFALGLGGYFFDGHP